MSKAVWIVVLIFLPITVASQSAFLQKGEKGSCMVLSGARSDYTDDFAILFGYTPDAIFELGAQVAMSSLREGGTTAVSFNLQGGFTIAPEVDASSKSFAATASGGLSFTVSGPLISGFPTPDPIFGLQLFTRPSANRTVQILPSLAMGLVVQSGRGEQSLSFWQIGLGLLVPTGSRNNLVLSPTVTRGDDITSYGFTIGFIRGAERLYKSSDDFH